MEKGIELVINLDLSFYDFEEIKKAVEKTLEIQKEHNCNCTLNVRIID